MKLEQIRMRAGTLKNNIIPIKVFQHLFKGIETAQCGRYLARQHIINFPHTLVNLRSKAWIPRYRIAVQIGHSPS